MTRLKQTGGGGPRTPNLCKANVQLRLASLGLVTLEGAHIPFGTQKGDIAGPCKAPQVCFVLVEVVYRPARVGEQLKGEIE